MDDLADIFDLEKSNDRSEIIDHAVKLEFLINDILALMLGLTRHNSISFGNTSQALSFNNKINLLLDLNILKEEHKPKLQGFSEIRNHIAHNLIAVDVNHCSDDIKNKLRKWYSTKKATITDYKPLYLLLYKDVQNITLELFEFMYKRAGDDGEQKGNALFFKLLQEEIKIEAKKDKNFSVVIAPVFLRAAKKYEQVEPPEKLSPLI